MTKKLNQRNSSIELLRIIAMLMIVMHHYSVHTEFDFASVNIGINKYFISVTPVGEWAVNIFILIFGYFGIKSKFKLSRILNLYVQVWFYSVIFFLAYTVWNRELHSGLALRAVLPIISNQYWFFSKYIVLCLLSPFINKLIENITREMHFKLIILLLILWSIIPSVIPEFIKYNLNVDTMGIFILLYTIGAYLRLYPDCKVCHKKISWIILLSSVAIMLVYKYFVCFYDIGMIRLDCFSNASVISIGFAVGAFCIFNGINLKTNKFINEISLCMFGIYLIHDNDYIRPFLWNYIIKGYNYQNSPYLILHMVTSGVIVFTVCLIIEFIRMKTIHKLWLKYGEEKVLNLFKTT